MLGRQEFALLYFWILFNLFALGMLVLDLRVFHRPGHVVGFRESLGWSAMYVVSGRRVRGDLVFLARPSDGAGICHRLRAGTLPQRRQSVRFSC